MELLSSADADLRKFAIDALAQRTGAVTQELLTIAVFDIDTNVAIAALENLMPPTSDVLRTRVLEKALQASHPMLEIAALDALVRIGDAPGRVLWWKRILMLEQLFKMSSWSANANGNATLRKSLRATLPLHL